jgi:hypothetical protein
MKSVVWCVALAFLLALPASVSSSQNEFYTATPTKCELNILYIDEALHEVKSSPSAIIAIAHPGDGESASVWNTRRLDNLERYVRSFRKSKVELVLAQGDPVRGLGRVNIYVRGQLFRVLTVARNKDLPVGTCLEDEENCIFFPWRENPNLRPCWPG